MSKPDKKQKPVVDSKKIIADAFMLGFMCSREGFNGECAYDNCADYRGLHPHFNQTEQQFREEMEASPVFRKMRDQAIARLAP